MRRITLVCLLVGLPLFVINAAEEKPNFTGNWKQDTQRSTPVDSSGRVHVNWIEHQDPNLKVFTSTTADAGPFSGGAYSSWIYRTDGKEQESASAWTTVSWQGPALLLLAVQKKGSKVTFTRETWTLSDEGKTLTKTRRIVGPEGVTHQTLVFEKR